MIKIKMISLNELTIVFPIECRAADKDLMF